MPMGASAHPQPAPRGGRALEATLAEFGAKTGEEAVDILIVDDQPEVLAVLKRQMQRKGYTVRIAGDAVQATAELASCHPRVILLDLMMPQIDGEAFLRNLRQTHSPGALPVIVVTASNQRADMLRCLDAGANDFMLKPVDLEALAARVELQVAMADRFRALERTNALYTEGAAFAKEALWEWRPDVNAFITSPHFSSVWGAPKKPRSFEEWVASWRIQDADLFLDELAKLRDKRIKQIEINIRNDADESRAFQVRARLECDADRIAGAIVDITEPYMLDGDSRLPALGAFLGRLERRRIEGKTSSVVLFDVGRFDELTLAHGIARGDDAIRMYIDAVRSAVEPVGELFRLGATEFAVVARVKASPAEVRDLARDIASGDKFGVQIRDGQMHRVSSAVGLVVDSVETHDETRFRAKLALKVATEAGLGRVTEYTDELREVRLRLARTEARLSAGLENGAVDVMFQPLADVMSGRWVGVEAIPHWCDEGLGRIAPEELASCADMVGRSLSLIELMARKSFAIARAASEAGGGSLFVSINLTAAAARESALVGMLTRVAGEEKFDLADLVLEVKEDDILLGFESCAEVFRKLNALGVRVAIDDFGSSYSCLTYLCRIPSQILKLDKAVLDAAQERADARTLLGTTSRMAQHLGKTVVLNGVEDAGQMEIAREVGAGIVQGGLTCRPLAGADLVAAIRALA